MDKEDARGQRLRERPSGVFGLSQKQLRNILRFCHLTTGMLLVPFVYSPLGDVAAFELAVKIALIPLTIITGVAMWQQAKLRKLIARGRPV